MNLKELVKEIAEVKSITEMDLSGWDPRTRTGMQIKLSEAKGRLKILKEEYTKLLTTCIALVPVFGPEPKVEIIRDLASNEGAMEVDVRVPLKKFANRVEASIDWKSRTFGLNQQMRLIDEFNAYCVYELGVRNLPSPSLPPNLLDSQVLSETAVIDAIKAAIVNRSGARFYIEYIKKSIIDQALEAYFDKPVLTVFVYGLTKAETELEEFQKAFPAQFPMDLMRSGGKNAILKVSKAIQQYYKVSAAEASIQDEPKADLNEEKKEESNE